MIIRCPDCSTGFKLPEDRVTSRGIKLRCSRCSHVFRVRKTESGESEIFYHAADRADGLGEEHSGEAEYHEEFSDSLEEVSGDVSTGPSLDEVGNRTMFGMPSVVENESTEEKEESSESSESELSLVEPPQTADEKKPSVEPLKMMSFAEAFAEKKASRLESSEPKQGNNSGFNPFSHTGLDLKPKKRSAFGDIDKAFSLDLTDVADVAAEELAKTDAFADLPQPGVETSQVESSEPQGPVVELAHHAEGVVMDGLFAGFDAAPAANAAVHEAVPAVESAGVVAEVPVAAEMPVAAEVPVVAEPVEAVEAGAEPVASALPGVQGNAYFGAAEDFADESFEHDGPYFDPERGASVPAGVAGAAPVAVATARKPMKPAVAANRAPVAAAQVQQAQVQAQPKKLEPVAEAWEVDDISTVQIGGSGASKILLVTVFALLIGAGFMGFVAAKNDGLLDFKQFGSMVEVAFGQGEYKPRTGGDEVAPVVVGVVETPIEVQHVFATLADYGRAPVASTRGGKAAAGNRQDPAGQVLVLRGQARNRSQQSLSGVKLRGLILNSEGRVLLETTAFLGGEVSAAQLLDVHSTREAVALLPKEAASLRENTALPFTLIFEEIPQAVLDQDIVHYRVEVASTHENVVTAQMP